MDSAEPALSYTQRLFCFVFSHSMCLSQRCTRTHKLEQTNCFHILFPDTRSCKQHVPVKWLCLALSRASERGQADRQTERAHTVCLWPTDYLSACLSPLIHSSPATRPRPHTALPLPLHVRVTNGHLSPRETGIIICTQSRREMSGNMHLSSQSMVDGCREQSLEAWQPLMFTFCSPFGFSNAAAINSLRPLWWIQPSRYKRGWLCL